MSLASLLNPLNFSPSSTPIQGGRGVLSPHQQQQRSPQPSTGKKNGGDESPTGSSPSKENVYVSPVRRSLEELLDAIDMSEQHQIRQEERRRAHEQWVQSHASETRFDHASSRIRANILVNEAWHQEVGHLQHQLEYARQLLDRHRRPFMVLGSQSPTRGNGGSAAPVFYSPRGGTQPSPSRQGSCATAMSGSMVPSSVCSSPKFRDCHSSPEVEVAAAAQEEQEQHTCSVLIPGSPLAPAASSSSKPLERPCACCLAPAFRQLCPQFRAMLLLRERCEGIENLEETLDTLRNTYSSDAEMLDDLVSRYGPEVESMDEVDPETRMRNVEAKLAAVDDKWREIGSAAMRDMAHRDAYQLVIRNLSIMRIFLEGSQSTSYGCDMSERARRDAHHQAVLDKVAKAMQQERRAAEMMKAMAMPQPPQQKPQPTSTPFRGTPIPPRRRVFAQTRF